MRANSSSHQPPPAPSQQPPPLPPNKNLPPTGNSTRPQSRVPSAKKGSEGEEQIIIHVCDENRQVNKDFKCRRSVLLSEMKYFAKHFDGNSSFEDIDISVHCDVQIFEWLMKYLDNVNPPALEVNNVISILISSEFL
jgi:hypothetical protein